MRCVGGNGCGDVGYINRLEPGAVVEVPLAGMPAYALRVRVEPPSRRPDIKARVKDVLTQFLARQGLTGIATRIDMGNVAAHPVSGKFRQVWREKPHHA